MPNNNEIINALTIATLIINKVPTDDRIEFYNSYKEIYKEFEPIVNANNL